MNALASRLRGRALTVAVAVLAVAACSSDGGVGGTGISTVQGNVLDPTLTGGVIPRWDGSGQSAANIRVAEPTTGVATVTDEAGWFELRGEFREHVTIEFLRSDIPAPTPSTMSVFVSVESVVTLVNVAVDRPVATAEEIQIELAPGPLVSTAVCEDDHGWFEFEDNGGLVFPVFLDAETQIDGGRTCRDLTEGTRVKILGLQQASGPITATSINVDRSGNPPR
jgi:hypothetical protein